MKIFKKSTILSAFAETGLIPYKPEKVLAPLREKLEKRAELVFSTSSTLSSTFSHTASTWPTSQDIPDLCYYADNLLNVLESSLC